MRTTIVSAFPGCGKTTYYNANKDKSIDSDSSEFSWITDDNGNKTRNPDFPKNYIDHIKQNIGKVKYIFVSSHKEVRDALIKEHIPFLLFYPSINRKQEFLDKYKKRGNTDEFVKMLGNKWEEWITDIQNIDTPFVDLVETSQPNQHIGSKFRFDDARF